MARFIIRDREVSRLVYYCGDVITRDTHLNTIKVSLVNEDALLKVRLLKTSNIAYIDRALNHHIFASHLGN